ncbi:MAG: HD domain-containing phosphohydrolase, partial [Syntrophomonadaceae bacterium]|nr:HD domain-containing phosphohydrolase [Syntrophomonadaceae bacterium]
ELPLFLDSIGTVLSAVAGGYLPGIIVGFLSNVINGISDPITLYYGILSIIIAVAATIMAHLGWFKSVGKTILAALIFAVIGGGLGSVMTWMLYGFNFGSGISAPFAILLYERTGLSMFAAQFTADMAIDVADKFITAFVTFGALRLLPPLWLDKMQSGLLSGEQHRDAGHYLKPSSLRGKVVLLIVITAALLGTMATMISYMLYRDTVTEKYINTASGVTQLMLHQIDADRVQYYLDSGDKDEAYLQTEARLADIRASMDSIKYMYVYQIREDGCYVVFDIDTPDLPGEELGNFVPYDEAFLPYQQDLLAGRDIDPIIGEGSYGWLLTVYRAMYDSSGQCVAYVAADIAMDDVVTDRYVFIIKMVSLLFGLALLIVALALWFAEKKMIEPIKAMTEAADKFAYDNEEERLHTTARLQERQIKTGDEIESLYNALTKTALDVARYIGDINEKAATIAQMQENIIVSFAAMVENRDRNTGEHIKHTAGYVKLIANEMRRQGQHADILTDEYVKNLVRSAPLHDMGKIEISDALLNKPGKLTDEEFDIMKTHTTLGRDILASTIHSIDDNDYLSAALDMATYHHERWDGAGYPEGLSGEDIPLSARIMAVADVFDALISKRSYKEAKPMEEAIEIIRSESGAHFDPAVVNAFLAVLEEIRQAS